MKRFVWRVILTIGFLPLVFYGLGNWIFTGKKIDVIVDELDNFFNERI